jgi:alpha-N-acetylglucosamine transferase
MLRSHGILIYKLPRLLDLKHKLGFAEMTLLKITPFSFTQYKRIQFLDGDVMPTRDMDCFFDIEKNSFTVGAVCPLSSMPRC